MAYLGNSPVLSQQEYRNIDNISGSFNGVTTSFALLVNGVAPVPAPQSSNQCLISVNGVVQKPDDTGATGFRISGGNIIFSSAPTGGQSFFGVILAGADYIYAGQNFPDGTVSAPSITFNQDLDTGFYRSGAGEVKFTANGANAVTLSSNNLTAPSFIPTSSSAPTNGVYLPAANSVAISTNGIGRLFINTSGNIGIGAGPSTRFYVFESGSAAEIRSDNGTVTGQWYQDGGTGSSVFGTVTNHAQVFRTNSTERLRITSAGLVGIGTSSPGTRLHVEDTSGSAQLRLTGSGGYTHLYTDGNFYIQPNGSTKMVVQSGGNVGIGTTSPSRLLHLSAADSTSFSSADFDQTYNFLRIVNTTNDKAAGIYFGIGTNGEAAITAAETTDGETALVFGTRGGGARSERARLDHAGRLLVGTSTARSNIARYGADYTPTTQIQTNSTSGWDNGLSLINYSASGYAPTLTFGLSASNTNGTNALVADGHRMGVITFNGNDGTNFEEGARIEAFVDGTPGANDMPGRLVFSTTADGASSPTERMRITSGGNLIVAGITPGAAGSIALRGDGLLQSKPVYGFAVSVSTRAMYMDADGFLGYITSVRESKTNIEAQSNVDWLYQLQPVSFNYKSKDRETGEYIGVDPQPQFGLIAEDVEGVCPELCFYDQTESGKELRGVQYEKLITPMLKALQQANQRIETLEAEVAALKAQ